MSPPSEDVEKSYASFELWVLPPAVSAPPGAPSLYPTLVTNSPEGTATGTLTLDVQADPYATQLAKVMGHTHSKLVRQEFGNTLFDALFAGDIGQCWRDSLKRIKDQKDIAGLRLLLSIRAPDLSATPWELLHDAEEAIAAVSNRSLARYLPVPEPPRAATIDRLRVLLVVESPNVPDLPPISENAQNELKEAIEKLGEVVDLKVLRNSPFAEIQTELQKDYNVLHFVAHGEAGKVFLVGGGDGPPEEMDQKAFRNLVKGYSALRLVILNACHSGAGEELAPGDLFAGVGSALVQGETPAVVAMQYQSVGLRTATLFSQAFYTSLANGLPVDMAVNEGRKLLLHKFPEGRDWSTPVLYLGTRTGRIVSFTLREAGAVKAAAREVAQESARANAVLQALASESNRVAFRSVRLDEWLDFTAAVQELRINVDLLRDYINALSNTLREDASPEPKLVRNQVDVLCKAWSGYYQEALTKLMSVKENINVINKPLTNEAQAVPVDMWFEEIQMKSNALGKLIEGSLASAKIKNIRNVFTKLETQYEVFRKTLRDRYSDGQRNFQNEVEELKKITADMHGMLKV